MSRTGEPKEDGPVQRLTKHPGRRPVTECGKHPLQHRTKALELQKFMKDICKILATFILGQARTYAIYVLGQFFLI